MNEQYSQEEMLYKHICEIMDQHHPDSSQSSWLTAEMQKLYKVFITMH